MLSRGQTDVTVDWPIQFEIDEVQPQLTDLERTLLFVDGQGARGGSVEERRIERVGEIGVVLGGHCVAGSWNWKGTIIKKQFFF